MRPSWQMRFQRSNGCSRTHGHCRVKQQHAGFVENGCRSSFLHIATHAVFCQDNPMFSGFKLADGWLTALDLFSITCQTNLVTLSGCRSE